MVTPDRASVIHLSVGVVFLSLLPACGGFDEFDDGLDDGLDRKAALTTLADVVIIPAIDRFAISAAALTAATATWSAEGEGARPAAQEAWREAMDDWQQIEVMQVGPAGLQSSDVVGGESIRDEIYSWPFTKPCGIDQQLVAQDYQDADFTERKLVYFYGLDALEYLLFVDGTDNACPGPDTINTDGSWAALSAEALAQRRADYAAAIAAALQVQAERLQQRWSPSGADFRSVLIGDAEGYAHEYEALDQVYDALFYLDLVVKEQKIGGPVGLAGTCEQEVCPELVESRFALRSREAIAANLQAARAIYTGGDEGGFDALLLQANKADMDETIRAKLDAADEAVQVIPTPLSEQLETDPQPVRDLYWKVQELTDALKGDFAAVLRLSVPGPGGGDTD